MSLQWASGVIAYVAAVLNAALSVLKFHGTSYSITGPYDRFDLSPTITEYRRFHALQSSYRFGYMTLPVPPSRHVTAVPPSSPPPFVLLSWFLSAVHWFENSLKPATATFLEFPELSKSWLLNASNWLKNSLNSAIAADLEFSQLEVWLIVTVVLLSVGLVLQYYHHRRLTKLHHGNTASHSATLSPVDYERRNLLAGVFDMVNLVPICILWLSLFAISLVGLVPRFPNLTIFLTSFDDQPTWMDLLRALILALRDILEGLLSILLSISLRLLLLASPLPEQSDGEARSSPAILKLSHVEQVYDSPPSEPATLKFSRVEGVYDSPPSEPAKSPLEPAILKLSHVEQVYDSPPSEPATLKLSRVGEVYDSPPSEPAKTPSEPAILNFSRVERVYDSQPSEPATLKFSHVKPVYDSPPSEPIATPASSAIRELSAIVELYSIAPSESTTTPDNTSEHSDGVPTDKNKGKGKEPIIDDNGACRLCGIIPFSQNDLDAFAFTQDQETLFDQWQASEGNNGNGNNIPIDHGNAGPSNDGQFDDPNFGYDPANPGAGFDDGFDPLEGFDPGNTGNDQSSGGNDDDLFGDLIDWTGGAGGAGGDGGEEEEKL